MAVQNQVVTSAAPRGADIGMIDLVERPADDLALCLSQCRLPGRLGYRKLVEQAIEFTLADIGDRQVVAAPIGGRPCPRYPAASLEGIDQRFLCCFVVF